jgi:DNA (cytosine-5)-methyltransferase 1
MRLGPACMGIDWMTGSELSQSIPPAYSEYIGREAMNYLVAATQENSWTPES